MYILICTSSTKPLMALERLWTTQLITHDLLPCNLMKTRHVSQASSFDFRLSACFLPTRPRKPIFFFKQYHLIVFLFHSKIAHDMNLRCIEVNKNQMKEQNESKLKNRKPVQKSMFFVLWFGQSSIYSDKQNVNKEYYLN